MTSQLSAALRAAAAGLHPDEAGTGLVGCSWRSLLRRWAATVVSESVERLPGDG